MEKTAPKKVTFNFDDSERKQLEKSPMIESASEDYNTDPNLIEDSSEHETAQIKLIET